MDERRWQNRAPGFFGQRHVFRPPGAARDPRLMARQDWPDTLADIPDRRVACATCSVTPDGAATCDSLASSVRANTRFIDNPLVTAAPPHSFLIAGCQLRLTTRTDADQLRGSKLHWRAIRASAVFRRHEAAGTEPATGLKEKLRTTSGDSRNLRWKRYAPGRQISAALGAAGSPHLAMTL
jgi:hypothetical protein